MSYGLWPIFNTKTDAKKEEAHRLHSTGTYITTDYKY